MNIQPYAGEMAREIDRLVIRGHQEAGQYPDKPEVVRNLTVMPALLNTVGVVLLRQPLTRHDTQRIVFYTPPTIENALIDANIEGGILVEKDGELRLTEAGRAAAEGVVKLQEDAIAALWRDADEPLKEVDELATVVVRHGPAVEPPETPSNFPLFAAVVDRPTLPARVLRLITALRYWRSDAHRHAIGDAGLRPNEAHALNVLWDRHRAVERVGQGFGEPGTKGVATLEERGLAVDGVMTPNGLALRQHVEDATDRLTAPIYEGLDEAARNRLLVAIRALPG